MVPGGRVELPTPAFSGPRSTGELPRHRGSQGFYGRVTGVSNDLAGWADIDFQPAGFVLIGKSAL